MIKKKAASRTAFRKAISSTHIEFSFKSEGS